MRQDKIPTTLCPYCGHCLSGTTMIGGKQAHPAAGDLSLCIECAGVCTFTAELSLKSFTMETLPVDHQIELLRTRLLILTRGKEIRKELGHRTIRSDH